MKKEDIQIRFAKLSDEDREKVYRQREDIIQNSSSRFFIETGRRVDDHWASWTLTGFAMMHLGFITSQEFYS